MPIKEFAIGIGILIFVLLFLYGCFKILIWSHQRGDRIAAERLQKQINAGKIHDELLKKRYVSARKSRDTFNKIRDSTALKVVIFLFFGIGIALFIRRNYRYYECLETEMLSRNLLNIADIAQNKRQMP